MKLSEIKINNFKRFTNLTITNLKESYKLILVIGPNGCGKSSLFDSFIFWMRINGGFGKYNVRNYFQKDETLPFNNTQDVKLSFFNGRLTAQDQIRKSIYVRTAYRNQDDFNITTLSRFGSPIDNPRIGAMLNNDVVVAENYQRLISSTLDGVFNEANDSKSVQELREELIGRVRRSLQNVFTELELTSIGDPLQNGSFFFNKGLIRKFHYKNLSGGEKSVFDLILDLIIRSKYYDNSIYCIDEPEAHMHSDLQAKVLRELYNIVPSHNQLWITTHSIGILNEARKIELENPGTVAFLDFSNENFDEICTLEPTSIESSVWNKFLSLTIGEFADLISPSKIILCEGNKKGRRYKDFDAQCYNKIFQEKYTDFKFVSIGNSIEVEDENNPIKLVLEELFQKEKIIRLVDRDNKSDMEIEEVNAKNIKVLNRRHLESYLLDDTILKKLCDLNNGDNETYESLIEMKQLKIKNSIQRGNASDDIKSAAGEIYTEIKKILSLTTCGNTLDAFLRDTIVPLITEDTVVYKELEKLIF